MVDGIVRERPIAEARRPRGRRIARIAATAAGWAALLAGTLGVGLHYGTWRWEPVVPATSFASYLMLGAPVAIVMLASARRWVSAGLAVVAAGAAVWSQAPMLWPDGTAPAGPDLVVMQSNLELGGGDAEAVVREVRNGSVELLTLEELTPELLNRLDAAGLAEVLPYQYAAAASGGQGTGIFSRYPLQDGVKFEGFWLNNLRANMIHPERGPVTVFAFHPIPPLTWSQEWAHELSRIHDLLAEQTGQVVVGGDFNSTWDHAAYRKLLNDRYADSAELLGLGALPTWPNDRSWGPVIGIDRILIAGGHATALHSATIPGTDHRAIIARLRL